MRYFMKKAFSRMRKKPHTFNVFVQHMNRVVLEWERLRWRSMDHSFDLLGQEGVIWIIR